MTSADNLEIKATINTGLPWKMVAKGSRSSTRRAKKQVARTAAPDNEAEYSSSSGTAAEGDSESEKLGVSVLGQQFSERVEHVPIKKRRFMVTAPSPLNRSSAGGEGSQHCADFNITRPISRLNPNLVGVKTVVEVSDGKTDCGSHDFSGIKILAEVACSGGMTTDIASIVVSHPVEPVQKQDALTLSAHAEDNDSSTGIVHVSGKDSTIESSGKVGESKSEVVIPQQVLVDALGNALAADQCEEHSMVTSTDKIGTPNISIAVSNESSTERPKENMEAGVSGNLAPQSETVTVSENISRHEHTGKGKNTECLTDERLYWDLNLPTDAWGQPCDVIDEVTRGYSDGEFTESVTESRHVDGNKDYGAGLITSDVHMNSTVPSGPKAEVSVQNLKECQSGYDSQFEDGELREPYPWEENEGDSGDVEQVDYGSESENERFYSLAESNENKLEDVEKAILAETNCGAVKCESGNVHEASSDIEKHVVVCLNDSHSKGSSPSRCFGSKPCRELPSHEAIPRRRPDSCEGLSERDAGPNKFFGRDGTGMPMRNRVPGKGLFGGWDLRHRFSPPIYKGGPYGFEGSHAKTAVEGRVMMNGFDQVGTGPGPHGYVSRQFSDGGYQGRFRRFPGGRGNRDFRGVDGPSFHPGDAYDYPSRIHNNRMNGRRERSNSPPVFRRLHNPQSRSRSRSRSPVSWNGRNRSPTGLRADENRMERVRLPFQKRFLVEQEMGFMSSPRNQRNSRFFDGRNDDGAGENHHNNLRGRKSPAGRMFRPEQRYDDMRRVHSDNNHFRSFVRHNNRRFGDGGGSRGGGGCKYEGAEEEKNGNRYEMVHHRPPLPGRLEAMEEDGDNIRRFRLNAAQQNSVVFNNNSNNEAS